MAPQPLIQGEVAHSLAREGVGEPQKFRRGDINCGTLYTVYTYFVTVPVECCVPWLTDDKYPENNQRPIKINPFANFEVI